EKNVTTGPSGEFAFTAEHVTLAFTVKVEAAGWAPKLFKIEATGEVPQPLQLGRGVVVTGRVLDKGSPVAGVAMGLVQTQRDMDHFLDVLRTKTDEQGRFRFAHAFADDEFWAFATVASLKDRGAVPSRKIRTGADGTTLDLGDLEVRP